MGDGGGEGGVQALHHLCTSWHRIDSAEERRRKWCQYHNLVVTGLVLPETQITYPNSPRLQEGTLSYVPTVKDLLVRIPLEQSQL